MAQLTKGMYGTEFDSRSRLFGLACGQMRVRRTFGHNAGWYNKKGEKIGWGDLETKDIKNIQNEINEDELFIILSESASFWKFVRRPGPIGSMSDVDHQSEYAPGQEYVAKYFMWCVSKKGVFYNGRNGYDSSYNSHQEVDGIHLFPMLSSELLNLMRTM